MVFGKYKDKVKKAFSKQALKDFWNKQGFYIILFICICAIGATAFLTSLDREEAQRPEEAEDDMIVQEQAQDDVNEQPVQQTDADEKVEIKIKDVVEGEDSQGQQNQASSQGQANKDDHSSDKSKVAVDKAVVSGTKVKPEVVKTSASAQTQKPSRILMKKPVDGNIVVDFATDHLQYSKTLKEWTTHPGIDIESPQGSPVKAAMDGVIESIEEDSLMGIVITIDHGNGLKTRYANLSTKDMVRVNQQVKMGQVISGVGRTAISEILDPPHVHFEVLKDGKNIDPKNYLE